MPKGCDLHYEVELAIVIGGEGLKAELGGQRVLDEWKGGKEELEGVVKGWCVGQYLP